jgi:hypothetical protein
VWLYARLGVCLCLYLVLHLRLRSRVCLQLDYDAPHSTRRSQRFFQIYNPNAARVTRAAILFDIGKLS